MSDVTRRTLLRAGIAAPAMLGAENEARGQFVESGDPSLVAHLDLAIEPLMPARVYLFKGKRPFRFSPVQALLPLRVDQFYRERLWY